MPKAKGKSPISFEKMEKEEQRGLPDAELNPLRALQSDPTFFQRWLRDAPNLKAVGALLGLKKKDEEE